MKNNKICAIISNTTNSSAIPPLTDRRSVSTLPFACKYRLLDFTVSSVMNSGADSVYMIMNQNSSQSVFDHLGSGREWGFDGIKHRYFMHIVQQDANYVDDKYYDSLIDYLKKSGSHFTIYMSANMVDNIDFKKVLAFHHKENATVTAVYKKVLRDSICSEDHILNINEFGMISDVNQLKDAIHDDQTYNLSLNAFVVNTDWLIQRLKLAKLNAEVLNGRQIIFQALNDEENTLAYEYTGYLTNVFDVHSYFQSNMDMLNYKKMKSLLLGENHIYTKLKNEAPTYYASNSNVRKSQFGAGCIVKGSVYNSVISRNVVIGDGTSIRNSIIMSGTRIGAGVEIQFAIVDKNVTIDAGAKITGTLQHPIIITKGSHIETSAGGRVTA